MLIWEGESSLMVNLESWPKSTHIFSKVTVGSTPPRSTLSKVILPKSLQILFKLSVDWPPDQHCQRWSFQSLCRSFSSWVSIDPPRSTLSEAILPKSLWILSKLSVDRPPPGSALSEAILPKSLWILSKLSVDQPPSPLLPPHLRNDNFQVESLST